MRASLKSTILGGSVAVGVIGIFLLGAVADRQLQLAPVNWLVRSPSQTATISPTATVLNTDEKSTVEIAEQASASVVTIAIERPQRTRRVLLSPFSRTPSASPSDTPNEKIDIGTGFLVNQGDLIITNKHVVDSEGEYYIIDRQDNEHKVLNIYRDPVNDLAILKIDGLQGTGLEMGDSDQLRVGQQVIAIGTALGEFRHTVTTGVVSGLGRGIEAGDPFGINVESLENVIQTDAAINPGNSGGPLLDSNGRVIGVNVAVSSSGQNISFAIPINVVRASIDNFNQTGQFERPMLGVRYRPISEQAAIANDVPQGAYIVEVVENTAASEGGIEVGDILTELDGQPLKDIGIPAVLNKKKVGDKVKVKYWRNGQESEVEVTLRLQQS